MTKQVMRGFKFLNGYNATTYGGKSSVYPVPGPSEKWGPWFPHPEPGKYDGRDCGPGGWHVMRRFDASFAPRGWWPWFAEARGILGSSDEKFRATEIRLRRISRHVFWKIIRMGYLAGANLTGVDLRDANLRGADLTNANLTNANLVGAYLRGADLTGAYPKGADLRDANLRDANLTRAYLRDANLTRAYLRDTNLTGAFLKGADLTRAYLRDTNLTGAYLTEAYLTGAYLTEADLTGTIFPDK